MLYDPKWEKPIETAPSYAGFIAWLERQNPAETYDWGDLCGCAVANYMASIGFGIINRPCLGDIFGDVGTRARERYGDICRKLPWTYGAALDRTRKIGSI